VKPGREERFIELHREFEASSNQMMRDSGLRSFRIVKTGDRSFCILGEWENFDSIVQARPTMIAALDKMRDILEDLGDGLGVTDPVSGEVVFELAAPQMQRSQAAAG
jgi:hypothetical protein